MQTWSDTQIVATVAAGSYSGNAQVLQNGVMSNAIPFTVNTPVIKSISPPSGGTGTAVTFTGSGFGASQGSGVVWLGSTTADQILSWSDTQVIATVASTALSGMAWIQQNGVRSIALGFTVPVSGGGNTLMPSLLNMSVGDTRTLQALGANGQTVTGLTWATSDPTIVSLSPDDPPLLTALAAGHVTITAGSGSTDVTVFPGPLPLGTVIWSNPGNGSGVNWIVPAVPSTTGVADVFAFQNDGTVQAITSDGSTAWTADVSGAYYWAPGGILPDFQGGLVAVGDTAIWKLDGITGQPYPAYSPGGPAPFQCGNSNGNGPAALHPDGTIIAVQCPQHTAGSLSLVGVDPTTGAETFSVPIPVNPEVTYGVMIAGDGYAYFPYSYITNSETGPPFTRQLSVFRVNSSGIYDNIGVFNWTSWVGDTVSVEASMITNADQGILLTWGVPGSWPQMAITTGAVATIVSAPLVPGNKQVYPVLQAQDGSFVGTFFDNNTGNDDMVAFDATGNVRWIVPNETPQIATADGGVIGQSGITYDQYGNATGMIPSMPTYSWKGAYMDGPVDSVLPQFDLAFIAPSYAAVANGNLTGNGTSLVHHTFGLVFCGPEGDGACRPDYRYTTVPVSFSYLPVSSLNDQTYSAPPPTGPVDFSVAHPDWVQTIRNRANDAYRAAFALLPAIVSQGWRANPISATQGFEHTVYVSGLWHTGGDFQMKGEPLGNTTGLGNCNNNGIYMAICATSNVWYLDVMGYAQQALEFIPPGGNAYLSPTYPPSDPSVAAQFLRVMTAIGTGIGNFAAHETGHQLALPEMDCSNGLNSACSEDYIYQKGNGSGEANDWFYGTVPGEKIHWTLDAQCKIYKFLGMKNTGCPN